MQLVVLGSGTSVPHSQRASAAFWLETDGGSMLLDCSADAMHRMAQENLDWPNLDAIWISHLHLDHCGGLASLLFAMKHSPQTVGRNKPLRIFSCSGVERLLKAIDESNDYGLFKQPFPLKVREFADPDQSGFTPFAGIRCEMFKTPHTRESLAMRLTNSENKTVAYSADTGVSEELAMFARGADLFVLECSFYENKPVQTHLNLAEAMRIAQIAEPRRLLLTHLYPEWDAIDLPAKAREFWPGETVAAHDGLRIDLNLPMTILSTFLTALAVMALTLTLAAAQTNGANETHLLESGQAGTLADPPRANELKIVSYNIRWRSGKELQQIIRWLKDAGSVRPAIIGLQEVDRARERSGNANHAKGIADELGMYYAWTAPHQTKPEAREEETGVAILSPYPLTEVTRIVLPNAGPGGRLRVAIGATVNLSEPPASAGGHRKIRVYSVHGETRLAERKKVEQQRAVLDDLQKFPKEMPVIILGDFNTWEAPAIKNLRRLYTTAGFETPFPDDESTFRERIVLFDLKLKLDWIWLRGLTPTSYGIDRSLKVSDHFPLWTVVMLRGSGKTS